MLMARDSSDSSLTDMTPTYTSEASETTPRGIKLLCVLFILASPFVALQGFSLIGQRFLNTVYGGILLLVAIASLAIAYGLWRRRLWGYILAVFNYGLAFLVHLLMFNVLGLLVVGFILYYLYNQRDHYL